MADPGNKIVPFGKYKGQPVEALAHDREYAEWLMAQPWFREKFQPIYNVIVNNFGEPSETPEHNAMQALFLAPEWALSLLVATGSLFDGAGEISAHLKSELMSDRCQRDAEMREALDSWFSGNEAAFKVSNVQATFEDSGIDVRVSAMLGAQVGLPVERVWSTKSLYSYAELKPALGDDYPAVLRQMKRHGVDTFYALVVGEYTGIGATWDQCCDFFSRSGIKLVTLKEVEAHIALAKRLMVGGILYRQGVSG